MKQCGNELISYVVSRFQFSLSRVKNGAVKNENVWMLEVESWKSLTVVESFEALQFVNSKI